MKSDCDICLLTISGPDASGIRDRDAELVIFTIFAVFGVFGLIIFPPVDKIRLFCGCWASWSSNIPKTIVITLVYFVNVWFLCFYSSAVAIFEFQAHLYDAGLYRLNFYLVCLLIGFILTVISMAGVKVIWAFMVHFMIANILAIAIYPCGSVSCYWLRLGIVLALVGILTTFLEKCLACEGVDTVISKIRTSSIGPICVVFSMANAVMGLEYWIDDASPWLLVLITVVLTAVREIISVITRRCGVCVTWHELIDEAEVLMEEQGATGK